MKKKSYIKLIYLCTITSALFACNNGGGTHSITPPLSSNSTSMLRSINNEKISPTDLANIVAQNYVWIDTQKLISDISFNRMVDQKSAALNKIHKFISASTSSASLLYLGSGGDILHPLINVKAESMEFITLQDKDDSDVADSVFNQIESIIKQGFSAQEEKSLNRRIINIIDTKTQKSVFSVVINIESYNDYIKDPASKKQFDFLMDKDSWLKDPYSWSLSIPERIQQFANWLKPNGIWIGGFSEDTLYMAYTTYMQTLFDNLYLSPRKNDMYETKWSGYEGLNIRKRNTAVVNSYKEKDDDKYNGYYQSAFNAVIDVLTGDKFQCQDIESISDVAAQMEQDKIGSQTKDNLLIYNKELFTQMLADKKIDLYNKYNEKQLIGMVGNNYQNQAEIINDLFSTKPCK